MAACRRGRAGAEGGVGQHAGRGGRGTGDAGRWGGGEAGAGAGAGGRLRGGAPVLERELLEGSSEHPKLLGQVRALLALRLLAQGLELRLRSGRGGAGSRARSPGRGARRGGLKKWGRDGGGPTTRRASAASFSAPAPPAPAGGAWFLGVRAYEGDCWCGWRSHAASPTCAASEAQPIAIAFGPKITAGANSAARIIQTTSDKNSRTAGSNYFSLCGVSVGAEGAVWTRGWWHRKHAAG